MHRKLIKLTTDFLSCDQIYEKIVSFDTSFMGLAWILPAVHKLFLCSDLRKGTVTLKAFIVELNVFISFKLDFLTCPWVTIDLY